MTGIKYDNVRRAFVDCEYGQMHVRFTETVDADTPHRPLICLHQSPKSGGEFAGFISAFGSSRKLIAPDFPGYGESDPSPENPRVTIPDYARAIWHALDGLGIERVDLFGNHTGSKVAAAMAEQQPDRVEHIIMISALILTPEEIEDFQTLFQTIPLDEDGTRFKSIWANVKKYRSPGMTLEMMANSFLESLRGGEAYEWGHEAAFTYNPEFADVMAKLPHKITVFNPADMLHELTPRIVPYLQNGEIIDYPKWGQSLLDIHTDDVVREVKKILE